MNRVDWNAIRRAADEAPRDNPDDSANRIPDFCPAGHEYTVHGYRETTGKMACRVCKAATQRAYRARARAARQQPLS